MPTQADVEEHREVVSGLVVLAQSDLAQVVDGIDLENARQVAAVVRELLLEIAESYVPAVSAIAADWYDDLRLAADVASPFAASVLEVPDIDDLQDAISDLLTPLFTGDPPTAEHTTLTLDGIAETLVTSTDRQTVQANVATDRARPVYARHASSTACTFCQMLASRGAEYTSKQAATRVVLRRAKRAQGEKYHDWCRCTAVPEWRSGTYEEAPYVAPWRDAYKEATKAFGGAQDTKAILAHMREALGNTK